MKKRLAIFLFLALILSFSFVSAGFFENLFSGKFTGEAARDFSMQLRRTATIGDSEVTITKIEENVATVVVKDSNTGVAEEFNAIEGETLTTKSGEQLTISGVESNALFTRRGSVGINFQPAQTPVPLPLPEKPDIPANIICEDSDGKDYYIKGEVSGFMPNQQIGGVYLDYCSSSTTLVERFCLKARDNNDYVYDESYSCSCDNGACIENINGANLEISIATLKDNYQVGEQIKLTDPPETGEVIAEQDNFLNKQSFQGQNFATPSFSSQFGRVQERQFNTIQDGQIIPSTSYSNEFIFDRGIISPEDFLKSPEEFNGYIVEFEEPSIIVKKMELEKFAKSKIKIAKYSKDLKKKNQKIEQKIIRELEKERKVRVKIEKEFTTAFNGIVLKDISAPEAKEIEKIKGVKNVWKNVKVEALLMDSVPLINANDVWLMSDPNNAGQYLTGEGIKIGIIDTGIDYAHSDLGGCYGVGCKVVGGYDFVNEDSDPMDDHGHGTHVSATAAGNGVLKGVAPDAKLYGFKVLDAGGSGWEDWIIGGIEASIDLDGDENIMEDENDYIDIISMSLGGGGNPDDPMSQAVDNVVDAGVVAVIAAGNDGCENCIGSPGTARKAITVAASDKSDVIAGFSSRGPVVWENIDGEIKSLIKPDITAPGVNICAAQWNDAWQGSECLDTEHTSISGTSMATPHVAGVVALIKQKHPDWTPEEIKMALRNTAVNIGENIITQGQGRVDVLGASISVKPGIAELSSIDYAPSGVIDIYGTANGNFYEVYYSVKDSGNWNLICSEYSESEINNNILCSGFDVDNLVDNKYELKLVVSSSGAISKDYGIFEANNLEITGVGETLNYIKGVENVYGNIRLSGYDEYKIEYQKEGEVTWNQICYETDSLTGDVLCSIDASSFDNGIYYFKLSALKNGIWMEDLPFEVGVFHEMLGGYPKSTGESFIGVGGEAILDNGEKNFILPILPCREDGFCYNSDIFYSFFKGDGTIKEIHQPSAPYSFIHSIYPNKENNKNSIAIASENYPHEWAFVSPTIEGGEDILKIEPFFSASWWFFPASPFVISDLGMDENNKLFISYYNLSSFTNIIVSILGFDENGEILPNFPIEIASLSWDYGGYISFPVILENKEDSRLAVVVREDASTIEEMNLSLYIYSIEGNLIKKIDLQGDTSQEIAFYAINSLVTGDLNNDGESELIVSYLTGDLNFLSSGDYSNIDAFKTYVKVFDKDGNFISQPFKISGYTPDYLSLGKFDEDGLKIVLGFGPTFSTETKENRIGAAIFDYLGSEIFYLNIDEPSKRVNEVAIGDVDGDEESEIIIGYNTPLGIKGLDFLYAGGVYQGIFIYSKDGTLKKEIKLPFLGFEDIFHFTITDFNNDGLTDILWTSAWFSPDKEDSWLSERPYSRIFAISLDTPYNPEKMDWPMFMHDPQHTGCYNCGFERPQSKIVNNENFNITGNLTMKLQKKTGLQEEKRISKGGAQKFSRTTGNQISAPLESWQDVQIVTSQQVTIPANDLIKLDVGGNYGWNLKNVKANNSEGDYRVYVSFEFNNQEIKDSWEFKAMPLGGVPVAPDAE